MFKYPKIFAAIFILLGISFLLLPHAFPQQQLGLLCGAASTVFLLFAFFLLFGEQKKP